MFTPHSAHPEPSLIKQARQSIWWDDSPSLRSPREIQANSLRARREGMTGYVPSLEAFTFVASAAEEGQPWLKGKRQVPLGFGWLPPGDPPYDELPIRANRIAYREFSRNPDLPFERFREILGHELFGPDAGPEAVDDLLELQSVLNTGRTWCQPSPATSPERVRAMAARGELTDATRAEIRAALDRVRAIAARYHDSRTSAPDGRMIEEVGRT
jgi:hypothetical protein